MQEEWVVQSRDQCVGRGVLFFFKQWGGVERFRTGRVLQDRVWDEMPKVTELSNGKVTRPQECAL
jgi:protein gp37